MKIRTTISTGIFITAIFILMSSRPAPAFAVSMIATSSAGDGVFLLQGIGIEDAAALEIIVSYDTTVLANPRVAAGPLIAGAMTAINPNVPGIVRMVIVRLSPVKGSGVIATLSFVRTGSSPGRITALSARLANIKGMPLSALVQVNNSLEAAANASDSSQGQNTAAGSSMTQTASGTSGTPSTNPATVIIAAQTARTDESKAAIETSGTQEKEIQPGTPEVVREQASILARKTNGVPVSRVTTAANTPEAKMFAQKSVLDRFKEYKGERTADSFLSLFEQESMIGCRQEPPVALSDGESTVKVVFITTPGNRTTSDVAVIGARLISLTKDTDNTNTWIAELIPEKGEYQASIAVSLGNLTMIFPLTIAPKINIDFTESGQASKTGFDRYIKKLRASKSSKSVLNREGKWSYRDDYILTANFLAATMKLQGPK